MKHSILLLQTIFLFAFILPGGINAGEAKKKASLRKAMELYASADAYKHAGDFAAAVPISQKSLRELQSLKGQKTVEYASVLSQLGELLIYTGKSADAVGYLSQAMGIWQDAFGDKRYDYARTVGLLGQAFGNIGRYEDAEPLFKVALEIYRKEPGRCDPDTARVMYAFGCMYYAKGDFSLAKPQLINAAQIWKSHNMLSDPRLWDTFNKLAEIYQKSGEKSSAERSLLLAADATYRSCGRGSREYAGALLDLSNFYGAVKETGKQQRFRKMAKAELLYFDTERKRKEKEKNTPKCLPTR